jgi:glycosyltransferase involved in cell wall biosynthesis
MRVGIATVHTPGIYGGAEFLADGLAEAVRAAGHSIHKISLPFHFDPPEAAGEALARCRTVDFNRFGGGQIDRLICLKFPAYIFSHPAKVVWLLHQHRPAYDLYGTPYGWQRGKAETDALREIIIAADREGLGGGQAVYTIAERVSARLREHNGVESAALYHPPADADAFACAPALPYLFAPSRLETLKRQELLIRALPFLSSPVNVVFAGGGSLRAHLEKLAVDLGVGGHVRFAGAVSRAEMLSLYSHATAVYFAPFDEDYGYVTLEAMLASKPVITCLDSGGPLEFAVDGETGLVVEPSPQALAQAVETLFANPAKAALMGRAGRSRYEALDISWSHVVGTLLGGDRVSATHALAEHAAAGA